MPVLREDSGTDAQSARTISPAHGPDRSSRSIRNRNWVRQSSGDFRPGRNNPTYADVSGVGRTGRTFKPEGCRAFQHVGQLAVLDLPGQEADRRDTIDGKNGGVAGHGAAGLRQILRLMVRAAAAAALASGRTVFLFAAAMVVVSGARMVHGRGFADRDVTTRRQDRACGPARAAYRHRHHDKCNRQHSAHAHKHRQKTGFNTCNGLANSHKAQFQRPWFLTSTPEFRRGSDNSYLMRVLPRSRRANKFFYTYLYSSLVDRHDAWSANPTP